MECIMPDQPSQTISAGTEEAPETSTDSTADSVKSKIDFVDTIIFTGLALGVDLLGVIPVVGEVMTPLGIGGFRLMFWFKGMNSSTSNWLMGGLGVSEIVPGLSEVLPGCTAYVLTICLTEQFAGDIKKVAETVAKVSPEPETKLVAAGVAAAMDMQQGKSSEEAVKGQLGNAIGGKAGSATGAVVSGEAGKTGGGVSTGRDSSAGSAGRTGGAQDGATMTGGESTMGAGSENDFRGNFDFGSVGADATNARATGDEKDKKRSGDLAESGKTPYATGSPLVEGQPQVGQSGDNVNTTFIGRRKKELEDERRNREEQRKAA